MVLVSQKKELWLAATYFGIVGFAVLLALVTTTDFSLLSLLALATTVALALGGFLHAIERSRKIQTLIDAPDPPHISSVEKKPQMLFRLAIMVLIPSAILLMLVWVGWGKISLVPGIFLGVAFWLFLDAHSLRRWEEAHDAEVVREANWGFAWLRKGDGGKQFVSRSIDAGSSFDV
jgi:hypothetical protein